MGTSRFKGLSGEGEERWLLEAVVPDRTGTPEGGRYCLEPWLLMAVNELSCFVLC